MVSLVARRLDLRDENSALLLLGLIVLAMSSARMFNLSTLLIPLIAGVLLRNTSERPWIWPRHFGTAGGVLVLLLFVIVGSSWSLEALSAGGLAAAVLLAMRALAKGLVVVGLARWSGIEMRQSLALTMALTPISGTALVMLADLQLSHPEFSDKVAPIILSAIAIMELIGPILVQWGLRLAREVQPHAQSRSGVAP
jgi:Kef-type K+ transport system membrane component KefB